MTSLADERANTQPKFAQPYAIVSLKALGESFQLVRNGCPVDGCRKPLVSQTCRVDGSCAKVTFLCAKNHPTSWTSCEQVGRQLLIVNKWVPAAAVMTGLKIVPMKRFLGLLQIDSQNADYMKSSAINVLVRLTNELYEEEVARVRECMLEFDSFDCGMFPSFTSTGCTLVFVLLAIVLYCFVWLHFLID